MVRNSGESEGVTSQVKERLEERKHQIMECFDALKEKNLYFDCSDAIIELKRVCYHYIFYNVPNDGIIPYDVISGDIHYNLRRHHPAVIFIKFRV